MLLNHDRLPVGDWNGRDESLCPDCGAGLVARRCEARVWHWAHRPGSGHGCHHEETCWHLLWKNAYLGFPGWEVERPLTLDGRRYRIDAMNPRTGRIREFVHSLSPGYAAKHRALRSAGLDVMWISDGGAFASGRRRWSSRSGGIVGLIKPTPYLIHDDLGFKVHFGGRLWRLWRDNVWFPMSGDGVEAILGRFEDEQRRPAAGRRCPLARMAPEALALSLAGVSPADD